MNTLHIEPMNPQPKWPDGDMPHWIGEIDGGFMDGAGTGHAVPYDVGHTLPDGSACVQVAVRYIAANPRLYDLNYVPKDDGSSHGPGWHDCWVWFCFGQL